MTSYHILQIVLINLLDPNAVLGRMFDAGKFDDMLHYCKTMLDKDPEDMLALQNSALALFHLKQFSEAISFCDMVLKIRESDPHALKIKIYSLEKLEEYEQVLDYCNQVLKDDPNDTWILNSMGLSLNELDRHGEAIKYYDRTLALDKEDITALMNKAISLYYLGDYKECIRYYDRAQTLDPTQAEISAAKSKAFKKLGLDDEAFLAAQGVLVKDMEKIKQDAKKNNYTVFHQFCTDEFERLDKKQSDRRPSLDSL